MRIRVVGGGHKINLVFPNAFIFNRLSSSIAARVLKKHAGITLEAGQLELLFKEVRKAKRNLRGLPLVTVNSAGGDFVEIKL